MRMLKKFWLKYKEFILYAAFGTGTFLINIITYWLCYIVIGLSNTLSNIIAWVGAVLFAFITNKLYVFESRGTSGRTWLAQALGFFGCRAGTEMLDLVIMYYGVDVMNFNALIMKTISNIIVIILNYIASKLFIFRKK